MSKDHERKPIEKDPYERTVNQDDNFDDLVQNWQHLKEDVILFFGAGASFGAKNVLGEYFPGAWDLRNEVWKNFMLPPEKKDNFNFDNLALMSLEGASTLAETKSGRISLERFIAQKFQVQKTLWQHGMIPFLNAKSIFTTNYDNLIETGFHTVNHGKQLSVIYNDQSSHNPNFLPLYKPHGTIERPHDPVTKGGFVITQFDYYEMMEEREKMLKTFIQDFQTKCVIFIGYSLNDFDIACTLYNFAKKNNTQPWYAVFPRNDADVRRMLERRFKVRQINKTFFNFMIDLDSKFNFIPDQWKFDNYDKFRFQ